jgi:protein gp37
MYRRFKWDPTIRFDRDALDKLKTLKKPTRIFIGSTMELFGEWVPPDWMAEIMEWVRFYREHTFVFLTKCPWNLPRWNPWPENCFVGMSATNMSQIGDLQIMGDVQAKVRFVSFEPLLDYTAPDLRFVNWVILGPRTAPLWLPPERWVRGIEAAADQLDIPVFEKDALAKLITDRPLRREMPW